MKRVNNGKGFSVMKKGHEEKQVPATMCAGGRYANELANESDLKGQVDGLANYAKKNKMKH